MSNQDQVKANVGSVVEALSTLITQATQNAAWNESVGASVSPGALRDAAASLQPIHDSLYALYQGEADITSVSP